MKRYQRKLKYCTTIETPAMRTISLGDGADYAGASPVFNEAPAGVTARHNSDDAHHFKRTRGVLKGTSELTTTDRNRARRFKKALKRVQVQQRDDRMRVQAAGDKRKRVAMEKRDALKDLSKMRGVTLLPHVKRTLNGGQSAKKRN